MSYEHIFNSTVKCSEELTPNEAIFAIGLMVMAVDGDIDMNEVEIIEGFLLRKGFTAQEVNAARKKLLRIILQEKNEALFYENCKENEISADLFFLLLSELESLKFIQDKYDYIVNDNYELDKDKINTV